MNYYNEFDPHAAAWLRQLIEEKLIPAGKVDTRSITDVAATDLRGFIQCHFFCGIGGWPLAFALAGWPADRPAWTGSCPCQPFSVAGKGHGAKDDRHLWPAWFGLIRECRPDVIFGEQVEAAIGHGWLDGIRADLEGEGYAVGDCTLGAHSVGAPHIRQRLYWGGIRLANGVGQGLEGHGGHGDHGHESRWNGTEPIGSASTRCAACGRFGDSSLPAGPWADSRWIRCRDGKSRRIPTQPGLFPLADGISYRLARRRSARAPLLRGAGNAIVPQVAAAFVRAFMDTIYET